MIRIPPYLDDDNICSILLGQFLQKWADDLAWSTPGGKEINYDNFVTGTLDLLIEVRLKMMSTIHDVS